MVIRFVQLSDIHFGQERNGSLATHDDVRDQLIVDAAALASERGPATRVLVAGDTAFSGKKEEFDRAGEFLDRLTAAVKCPATHVRLVPGNHDCDRAHVGIVCGAMHRQLRTESIENAHGLLEALGKESEEANPLLPKLGAYRTFASGYCSQFQSIGTPIWSEDYDFPNGVTLRLVGLNSVQVCDATDSMGNMILGNRQYTLPTERHVVYAVMVHHPLEWFKDKVTAKQYLHSRARVLMFGHEHIPDINKTMALQGERLEIFSGATNPPEQGALYRHAYNWIEVESTIDGASAKLHVTVFPRAWVPERTCFDADLNRLGGERSRRFDIACVGTVACRPAPVDGATNSTAAPGAAPYDNTGSAPGESLASNGVAMNSNDDEEGLATLKLLFWRHLDWRQRLTVLVKADVLPPTADKPVSQTLEELAIERARNDGKLGVLWDAMMALLPEAKRQANPFLSPGR